MDDEVWNLAPKSSPFVQDDPVHGVQMTERTEFRVLYDDRALYLGFCKF